MVDVIAAPGLHIVTLDNYRELLPQWTGQDGSCQLFAIVDMGSNGIRFTISDLTLPTARLLKTIYKERAAISLYDALNTSGTTPPTFPSSTITAVSQTIARFQHISVRHHVPPRNFTILATEAMRAAGNAADMVRAISAVAPVAPVAIYVLAPAVETLLGAVMGSRSAFSRERLREGGIFLDLGGGSVQMSWIETGEAGYEGRAAVSGKSLPFGAARLARILDGDVTRKEVRVAELDTLRRGVADAFARLCRDFPELAKVHAEGTGVNMYMCGGGFRGYGSMLMHHVPGYPIPSISNYVVSGSTFKKTKKMKEAAETAEGKIFGVSKRRRAQFQAIVKVVEAVVGAVEEIRSVTFCSGGNREGCLMMGLPEEIRERDPETELLWVTELGSQQENLGNPDFSRAMDAVVGVLTGAIPGGLDTVKNGFNIFSLGLGPFFAAQLWDGTGRDEPVNAAKAIYDATNGWSNVSGFDHISRAVFAVTMAARWGNKVAVRDGETLQGLRKMVREVDALGLFWADFVGIVARVYVHGVPRWGGGVVKEIGVGTEGSSGVEGGWTVRIKMRKEGMVGVDEGEVKKAVKKAREGMKVGKVKFVFEELE